MIWLTEKVLMYRSIVHCFSVFFLSLFTWSPVNWISIFNICCKYFKHVVLPATRDIFNTNVGICFLKWAFSSKRKCISGSLLNHMLIIYILSTQLAIKRDKRDKNTKWCCSLVTSWRLAASSSACSTKPWKTISYCSFDKDRIHEANAFERTSRDSLSPIYTDEGLLSVKSYC